MKKICCFLLLLAMLTTIISYPAIADELYTLAYSTPNGDSVMSLATAWDELYFLAGSKIYAYDEDKKTASLQYGKDYSLLASGGDCLYGVQPDFQAVPFAKQADGTLWPGEPISLGIGLEEQFSPTDGCILDLDGESSLCVLLQDESWSPGGTRLAVCDLKTARTTTLQAANVLEICQYRDGKLLALMRDMQHYGKMSLILLDVSTGAQEPFLDLSENNAGGLDYDAPADTVYLGMNSMLFKSSKGAALQECGALPVSAYPGIPGTFFKQKYVIDDFSSLYECAADADVTNQPTLHVLGIAPQKALKAFKQSHPGVIVNETQYNEFSQSDIASNLILQNDDADLIATTISNGSFPLLKEKGYYVDLAGSGVIKSEIGKMLPQITDFLWKGSELCAYPNSMYGENTFCYNKTLWGELGFTQEELPHTFGGLIDFTVRWMEEYENQYPDIIPLNPSLSAKIQLSRQAVYQYTLSVKPIAGEKYFDVPLLNEILEKLDKASPALNEVDRLNEAANKMANNMNGDYSSRVLFDFYGDVLDRDSDDWQPLLLPLGEGIDPSVLLQMDALMISPYSKNKELAMDFIECAAASLDAKSQAMLYADENRLVEDPNYSKYINDSNDKLKMLRNTLSTASPEDKKSIEEDIASQEEYTEELQNNRWEVPADTILRYKGLIPYLRISGDNTLWKTMYYNSGTLFDQYDGGLISGAEFLKGLDRVYAMQSKE